MVSGCPASSLLLPCARSTLIRRGSHIQCQKPTPSLSPRGPLPLAHTCKVRGSPYSTSSFLICSSPYHVRSPFSVHFDAGCGTIWGRAPCRAIYALTVSSLIWSPSMADPSTDSMDDPVSVSSNRRQPGNLGPPQALLETSASSSRHTAVPSDVRHRTHSGGLNCGSIAPPMPLQRLRS